MDDNRITQKKLILAHMRNYGSIEPLTALREYGIYRLGSRICDLRKDGYDINTERVTTRSRITGYPVTCAKYTLR